MTSSPTTRNRLNKQGTGDNSNTWGEKLNSEVFDLLDTALDGWTTKALTADVVLTSSNYVADESRSRVLNFTGTGSYTVTVPALEKAYFVRNSLTGTLTIASAGGGASATLSTGEVVFVITNGTAVYRLELRKLTGALDMGANKITSVADPDSDQDAATKKYVDDTAFDMAAGALPGQSGNAGNYLSTDGSTASWVDPFAEPTIDGPTITGSVKATPQAVASTSIDLSSADFFTKSISGNTTFTFDNATAGKAQAFAVQLTISSSAVPTWPAAVDWSGGVAPTLANGTHVLGFLTFDGATFVGVLAAAAVS